MIASPSLENPIIGCITLGIHAIYEINTQVIGWQVFLGLNLFSSSLDGFSIPLKGFLQWAMTGLGYCHIDTSGDKSSAFEEIPRLRSG